MPLCRVRATLSVPLFGLNPAYDPPRINLMQDSFSEGFGRRAKLRR